MMTLVFGGDAYLNSRAVKAAKQAAVQADPSAEVIELDAADTDVYSFEEAVSPSLLSATSIVVLTALQEADERLAEAVKAFAMDKQQLSSLIAVHDGSAKGRKLVDSLKKRAGVRFETPEALSDERSRMSFVRAEFRARGRKVQEPAVRQLVAVLGGRTGELAAMCEQLCFDCQTDPVPLDAVMGYLSEVPEVTGFAVVDIALEGKGAQAVLLLRQAVRRGVEPLALLGAAASKLRSMGKAAAIAAGRADAASLKMNGWFLTKATQQVRGWTSEGLAACFEALAHADQEAKSSSGDPLFALEQALELMAAKGLPLVA